MSFRRCIAGLFAFVLSFASLVAQSQYAITGNLSGIATSSTDLLQARFTLANCGTANPIVPGITVIVRKVTTFTANLSGDISGALWGNDQISCNLGMTTVYQVAYLRNNVPTGVTSVYRIVAPSPFNLNTATPVAVLPSVNVPASGFTCPSGQAMVGIQADWTPLCGTATTGAVISPAGTGFNHTTSGVLDSAARAVDLSGADVTGLLPNANLAHSSVNINGTPCPLGGGCSIPITGAPFTLTNTGTAGAATFAAGVLNIPIYPSPASGFPFNLGATAVAGNSTVSAVNSLTVNGVFLNATGNAGHFLNEQGDYIAPPGGYTAPSGTGFPHITSGTQDGTAVTVGLASSDVSGILPVGKGGTGTSSPGLVNGANITITGSWPNQVINSTGGGATLPTSALVYGLSGTTSRAAIFSDIVPLWGGGSCVGFLRNDGSCANPSGTYTAPTGTGVPSIIGGVQQTAAVTAILAAPPAGQNIVQPSGTAFNISHTNCPLTGDSTSNCMETDGVLNTYPGDSGSLSVNGTVSYHRYQTIFNIPGWNYGSTGMVTSGWMTSTAQTLFAKKYSQGIGNGQLITIAGSGRGDVNGTDVQINTNGGYEALSDEGQTAAQWAIIEAGGAVGTVLSGGARATTVSLNVSSGSVGVGRLAIDTSSGAFVSTETAASSVAIPGGALLVSTLGTPAATSSVCGVVAPGPPVTTTGFSITGGVLTITGTNPYSFGQVITLSGYTGGNAYLNGTYSVGSSTGTTFSIFTAFADVAFTSVTASAIYNNVEVVRQAGNAGVATTFGVVMASPYSVGSPGPMAVAAGLGFISKFRINSAVSYSGGVQYFTANLREPIFAGAQVCVGGLAGYEQINNTLGVPYYVDVIGNPTTTSVWVGIIRAGLIRGPLVGAGTWTMYPGATITATDFSSNTILSLTDNDMASTAGHTITVPDSYSASYTYLNAKVVNNDPFAQFSGMGLNYSGSYLYDPGQYVLANGFIPSNLISQGGKGYAPVFNRIKNHIGNFAHLDNPPSDAYRDGNTFPAGLFEVECDNAGGVPYAGCNTQYNLWRDFTSGGSDSYLQLTRATGVYNLMSDTGTVDFKIAGSSVCRANGTNCPAGGAGTVTSVGVSGGTTGLTTSGGPVTGAGTITLGGTLAVANGGTGTASPGLVNGANITITGSWPNQTISSTGGGIPYPSGSGIPVVVTGTSWGTTVPAPAGNLVGDTATQTLTNKSIAASEINSGTLPTAQTAALTGDVTKSAGSNATTVVAVNSAPIPVSAPLLASNGSGQFSPVTLGSGLGIASGVLSSTLPVNTQTAGTGGVTLNYLVSEDTSNPVKFTNAALGSCGVGTAGSTVASGSTFTLNDRNSGAPISVVADGTITAKDLLVAGAITAGTVASAGAGVLSSAISSQTCIAGSALQSATVGQTFLMLPRPRGSTGTKVDTVNSAPVPTAGGPTTTNTLGQVVQPHIINSVTVAMDSYGAGTGVPNPLTQSIAAMIFRATPAPPQQYSVAGQSNAGNLAPYAQWIWDPNVPSVLIANGTENDAPADACGATTGTNCLNNATNVIRAQATYGTIPYQYRKYASNCVQTSGTWTTDSTIAQYVPTLTTSPGNGLKTSSSTAVLTCTITTPTATTVAGIMYPVTNAGTGPFTVTADGVSKIDGCGNATFSSGPCGGQPLILAPSGTEFAAEFTGLASSTTHTLVVTTSTTNNVGINSVYAIPPVPPSNENAYYYFGAPTMWTNYALYNTAVKNVLDTEHSEGLYTAFVDTTSLPASDFATSKTLTNYASTSGNHPNYPGTVDFYTLLHAVEMQPGNFQFSSPNLGGPATAQGVISSNIQASVSGNSFQTESHQFNVTQTTGPINLCPFESVNGANAWCFSYVKDASTGKPWSNLNAAAMIATNGFDLFEVYDGSGLSGASHVTAHAGFKVSTGDLYMDGGLTAGLTAQGTVATLNSAATIAPTSKYLILNAGGVTTVTTITPPSGTGATVGADLDMKVASGITFTTGGNIASAPITTSAATLIHCFFAGTTDGNWYCK